MSEAPLVDDRPGLPVRARRGHDYEADAAVVRDLLSDIRSHAGAVGWNTRASPKAGVRRAFSSDVLLASCEAHPAGRLLAGIADQSEAPLCRATGTGRCVCWQPDPR